MILRALGAIAWRSIVFLLAWGLLLAPVLVLLGPRAGTPGFALEIQLAVDALSVLTVLAASWGMLKLIERRRLAAAGLALPGFGRDILVGFGLGLAWLVVSLAPLALGGSLTFAAASSWPPRAFALATLAVGANAFAQEALVHGYLFSIIQWRFGGLCAVVATSLLFAALHLPAFHGAWLPAINVFLAGAMLGLARWRTSQLWMPAAIHFGWNFALGPLAGLTLSGKNPYEIGWHPLALQGTDWWSGGSFGLEGSVVVTATVLGLMAIVGRIKARPEAA